MRFGSSVKWGITEPNRYRTLNFFLNLRALFTVGHGQYRMNLSPPATSVDVERLFSTAGDIRTQERNRLSPENTGQILFLKENLPRINFEY